MKEHSLLFIFFFFTLTSVFGEIKNGYEKEIFQMRESLKRHSASFQASDNRTLNQKRKIQHRIDLLLTGISNYELTENLLKQFKIIAPDLYNEIDTLKDLKGRNVDVYVKFIPRDETKIKAWGTTYMSEAINDKDAVYSEYGKLTVSVKIWIVNKALFVLAHELGHIKYQVPHFATYMKYYKNNYYVNPPLALGHNSNDLSGRSALQYAKRFRKEYFYFLRMKNEKIPNPLTLMDRIRKSLTDDINL